MIEIRHQLLDLSKGILYYRNIFNSMLDLIDIAKEFNFSFSERLMVNMNSQLSISVPSEVLDAILLRLRQEETLIESIIISPNAPESEINIVKKCSITYKIKAYYE